MLGEARGAGSLRREGREEEGEKVKFRVFFGRSFPLVFLVTVVCHEMIKLFGADAQQWTGAAPSCEPFWNTIDGHSHLAAQMPGLVPYILAYTRHFIFILLRIPCSIN